MYLKRGFNIEIWKSCGERVNALQIAFVEVAAVTEPQRADEFLGCGDTVTLAIGVGREYDVPKI